MGSNLSRIEKTRIPYFVLGGSFASLPRDEYIPGGALIGDRDYGDIRYLQVPNEHRIQGDAVFVARDSKTFCDAFKSSHGSESWTKRAEATAKLTDFLIVAGGRVSATWRKRSCFSCEIGICL